MNDKIVPSIIEHEGIKYVAVQFYVDAIDENRMLWTENEKLLQRIDKAVEYIEDKKVIIDTNSIRIFDLFEIEEQGYKDDLLNILRGDE